VGPRSVLKNAIFEVNTETPLYEWWMFIVVLITIKKHFDFYKLSKTRKYRILEKQVKYQNWEPFSTQK